MTEQQPYEVIEKYADFEVRRYPAHLVAEITVSGSLEGAGNRAFRTLFGYISGQNTSRQSIEMTSPMVQEETSAQKIAMTAPVVQSETSSGDHVVAFVLPSSMQEDSAPVPTNSEVRIRTVPGRLAAAMGYPGRWTGSNYHRHLAKLERSATAAGLELVGTPRWARFDPPFKPWFLRHNEVVRDVAAG